MYIPETLLTKYVQISRQNTELKQNEHFQVSVKHNNIYFPFLFK
jgi:septum formation topological specificity factor MinE